MIAKRHSSLLLVLILTLLQQASGLAFADEVNQAAPVIDQPHKEYPLSNVQVAQRNRGYGMFIHFGINTYHQTEWSDGTLPASSYNPTELDCDQWIRIAKEAGFRYVILVAKHHEGFCLWDSKYTEYDVASSPVKTDVVAEVAKACKKYGVELGIYYSLWDRNHPSQGKWSIKESREQPESSFAPKESYRKYMLAQLEELMTNYGDVCELWLDGGWRWQVGDWDIPELYQRVRSWQPNCSISVNHSIRQPGSNLESIRQPINMKKGDPVRYWPIDVRLKDPALARWDDPQLYRVDGKLTRLPFEHTICISELWNWFQKNGARPVRELDELEQLFYWTTNNDNTLIVNLPPDKNGKMREYEAERIIALAERLGIRNGGALPTGPKNLLFMAKTSATSELDAKNNKNCAVDYSLESYWEAASKEATLEIDPGAEITFDQVVIHEDSVKGKTGDKFSTLHTFHVEEFKLQFRQKGEWVTYYVGADIKHAKRIDFSQTIRCDGLRLVITKASAPPRIAHISCALRSTRGLRPLYKLSP